MQDDDDNDDPMILNISAKNHTLERTIVPWTVIFYKSKLSWKWKSLQKGKDSRLEVEKLRSMLSRWSDRGNLWDINMVSWAKFLFELMALPPT